MNNQPNSELPDNSQADEMLSEYNFDYRKARPNRFASQATVTVTLLSRRCRSFYYIRIS